MIYKTIFFRKKINFVIIDTYSTSNFYYALIISQICRILNLKYIPCLHGGNLIKRVESSTILSKMIFNNSYLNIAPSNYFYEYFINKNFNVKLIPNYISISKYKYYERKKPEPKILWVRALQDIYNPKMAIDVLGLIKIKYPEASLCMVGAEKNMTITALEKYANEKKLTVTFTGKLTKNDWIELSQNFDFFINTTNFDNTPVSVIEAMSLGLVVVSTNVGGIPFLFKDNENVMLCNKNDAEEMSKHILNLIENNEEYNQISSNARKFVENFDEKHVIKLWNEVLK